MRRKGQIAIAASLILSLTATTDAGDPSSVLRNAFIDGQGEGWRDMVANDFKNVNCHEDTWTWKDHELHCTGKPIGVIRSQEDLRNFELVLEWKHLQSGGNSGIFAWTPAEAIQELEQGNGRLPSGIEVQVLDEGYGKADWFTCHGDVFPCGTSNMKPFPPVAPNGKRSFPCRNLTKPFGHWNH